MQHKYEVMGIVGEGAYGIVYKCKNKDNGEFVAIKKFKETEDDIVKKSMLRELKVLKILNHENIVEFKEAFKKKGNLYLVFEYVEKNLLELLQETPGGLEPKLIKNIIFQLCLSIKYIHDLNLVHRDIKPENLLIDSNNKLKLCDFGFARQLVKGKEPLTDYVATRWYRAPELLLATGDYDPEVDHWAIGCIMGELVDGEPLFPGENEIDQLCIIQKVLGNLPNHMMEILTKSPNYSREVVQQISKPETLEKRYMGKLDKVAINFMKNLLQLDPKLRLKGNKVFEHPYFEGMVDADFLKNMNNNNYANNNVVQLSSPSINKNDKHYKNNHDKHDKPDIIINKKKILHLTKDNNKMGQTNSNFNKLGNVGTTITHVPIINNTTNISIINFNYDKQPENKAVSLEKTGKNFNKTANTFFQQKGKEKNSKFHLSDDKTNILNNTKNFMPYSNYENQFKTFYNGTKYNYDIDLKNTTKGNFYNSNNSNSNNNAKNIEKRTNKFNDEKSNEEKSKAKSLNNMKNTVTSKFFYNTNNTNNKNNSKSGEHFDNNVNNTNYPTNNMANIMKNNMNNMIHDNNHSIISNAKIDAMNKYFNMKGGGNTIVAHLKPIPSNNNFQLPSIVKNSYNKKY